LFLLEKAKHSPARAPNSKASVSALKYNESAETAQAVIAPSSSSWCATIFKAPSLNGRCMTSASAAESVSQASTCSIIEPSLEQRRGSTLFGDDYLAHPASFATGHEAHPIGHALNDAAAAGRTRMPLAKQRLFNDRF
jgi:hypothetical protein